jgi:hypothetical protein
MLLINNELEQMCDNANNAKISLAPKAKRSVSFYPNAKGKLALHINDYTEEEIQACWYNREDFKEFKRAIRLPTVHMMERNRKISEEYQHCRRGLESRTRVGTKSMLLNTKMALLSVFKERDYPRLGEQITKRSYPRCRI